MYFFCWKKWFFTLLKKSIEVFKINVSNGRFVLFEVVQNHQIWETALVNKLCLCKKKKKKKKKTLEEEENQHVQDFLDILDMMFFILPKSSF